MTAAVDYPCTLPTPLAAQFSNSEQLHWRRNDVQNGPPRYEHLTDSRPTLFSVGWSFDAMQLQSFEAWYRTIVNFGSTPFNIDLAVGGGIKAHECYFDKSYDVTKAGKRWIVTTVLLAVAKQYDDDCTAQEVLAIACLADYRELAVVLSSLDLFANTTLPDAWESIKYGTDYS